MNIPLNSGNRKGFIIVISLTLMLVMMTMGIGLYFSSKQSAELVGANVTKADSFYSAESCIAEARLWLRVESASGAPCINTAVGTICHNIASTAMSNWQLTAESQIFRNRTVNQVYQCSIALLGQVAYEGGEGVGFDVGEGSGYGNAATQTKYMYRIRSQGSLINNSGMNNFLSEVEVVDSMIF